ncbi:HK97 gp10 family phage protein [Brevibacillus borstelensis]|jgi:hypothetical protein|uniref:HK97 gp10 family phage protein n=1 Tax=Brevibacillus borstelensis TaxID=45462 RepID=UPI002430BBBA|nr:HK97 gp10 family phage protein [Brevibacillus borstelensis]
MDFDKYGALLKRLSERELEKIEKRIMQRIGITFLKMIRDELKRQGLTDSKKTWQSFMKGKRGNVWKLDKDRNTFTLEVGSWWYVARFLDEGYEIKEPHFVPGYFSGSKFVYEGYGKAIGVKRGVIMKPRTFIGRHYIDIALEGFQGGMVALIDRLFEKELKKVLG